MTESKRIQDGRSRLLIAALEAIRTKGFNATSVDDLCKMAGVTKGAFFHHFASKEGLGVAAAEYWAATTGDLFRDAPYHDPVDPLDRIFGYLEFRKVLLAGDIPDFTCLVGTMVQEVYDTSPAIREACDRSISDHARTLEADIAEAIKAHGVRHITAESLALHMQAVLQGAFILAKAKGSATIAADSIDHLARYIGLLFGKKERP
jgi:TetR/AcrR family transcriptional repressor of nem operon